MYPLRPSTTSSGVGPWVGARQWVEARGDVVDNPLTLVLRRDPDCLTAMPAVVRQRVHDAVRNPRGRGWQRRQDAEQALRIEARQQAVGDRRVDVARSKVLLLESRWAKLVELRGVASRERLRLVGQAGERGQTEDRVDRLDHRVVIALDVRDGVRPRVGGDQDQGHADAAGERQSVGAIGQDAWRDVVVEAIRLVVGDDDCALLPELRIRRDRVDRAGRHRLADLAVAVAWVVVVARLGLVNGGNLIRRRVRVRDRRCQPLLVRVAAADVEHAAFGQRIVGYVGEEVTKPA